MFWPSLCRCDCDSLFAACTPMFCCIVPSHQLRFHIRPNYFPRLWMVLLNHCLSNDFSDALTSSLLHNWATYSILPRPPLSLTIKQQNAFYVTHSTCAVEFRLPFPVCQEPVLMCIVPRKLTPSIFKVCLSTGICVPFPPGMPAYKFYNYSFCLNVDQGYKRLEKISWRRAS